MGYTRPQDGEASANRVHEIRKILWVILFLNLGVALAKLVWGLVTNSAAMQADGFHSLFDGTSNVVGLVGMAFAGRPADREHPYGHAKYETYASAIIAVMLGLAAYRIGSTAVGHLVNGAEPARVDAISFVVMVGTLAVNLFITTWERRVGRRLGSEILVADASHTGSDVLVSIGVIISLVLVKMGFQQADPIVALFVAGAIVYTAWGVFKAANATLFDAARIPADEVCAFVCEQAGVLGAHHVRTRGPEGAVYVDLHIQVDATRTVADGHNIAEAVERAILEHYPHVVDAIVHLEPFDDYQADKTAREVDAGLV
ncbi:MAG TPA: cation diffusion facilitator family transporter [Coriobacteriia bacterium]|nr:cation diffusion facilitator family transporter [Coriobacteriia bacterium]